jgi:CheY-like chemotaxis protein
LQQYTQNIIIKGVKSEERLLDETSLFLHRVVNEMPEKQRKMLINLHDKDEMFRGKTVLIADDDMRNVFALTQVLEESNMKVIMASNGRKAIEALNGNPGIDLILMDIMMPVMDGYEAMQSIRKIKSFEKLPIIALTAKAMKEDREKSLAAGASDYLTKPVDIDKLFNLMRIWLYQ